MRLRSFRRHCIHYIIRWKAAFLLATGLAVLGLVWHSRQAAQELLKSQYRKAAAELSKLEGERQRILDDLARNRRLMAWREARIEELKEPEPIIQLVSFPSASKEVDSDISEFLRVSVAEDEFNLINSRKRRASLEAERLNLEQQIESLKAQVRQLQGASGRH